MSLVAAAARIAQAAPWVPSKTIVNPTPAAGDFFGSAVAFVGIDLLAGARFDDTAATDADAGYLVDSATGGLRQTFLRPVAGANDQLGFAVAVAGSTLAIGAPHANSGAAHSGAVEIFDSSNGHALRSIGNPTPAFDDLFGWAVAATPRRVLVGAPFHGGNPAAAGEVYLFDSDKIRLIQTIANPSPVSYAQFGYAVAMTQASVVIGAPYDGTASVRPGAAYVFDATSGQLVRVLKSPRGKTGELFGLAVAAEGASLLVGAPYDGSAATNAGAVYLFDASSGTLLRTLVSPRAGAGDRFGSAVAMQGGLVLVGAPFDDGTAADSGAAFLFDGGTGALLATLENPTPAPGDQFGSSVALAGNLAAVGDWLDDTAGPNAGAVYLFADQGGPSTTTTSSSTSTSITVAPTSTLPGGSTLTTTTTFLTTTTAAPDGTTTTTTPDGATTTTTRPDGTGTTTSTTLPGAVACDVSNPVACDDSDSCTADTCTLSGCRHNPVTGFDSVLCRLAGLRSVLQAAPPEALGGLRMSRRLATKAAAAERLIERARSKRSAGMLKRAERKLDTLAAAIAARVLRGSVDRAIGDRLVTLANDAARRVRRLRLGA